MQTGRGSGGERARAIAMLALALAMPLGATMVAAADDPRAALQQARQNAAAAAERAARFEQRANESDGEAARREAERRALAARLDQAVADVEAAEARIALLAAAQAEREARLEEARQPMLRLAGALTTLARRPASLFVIQPRSTTDLVHIQAILRAVGPDIEQRTAALRADIAAGRSLVDSVRLAGDALAESRRALSDRRGLLRASGAGETPGLAPPPDGAAADPETAEAVLALAARSRAAMADIDLLEDQGDTDLALAALDGPEPRARDADDGQGGGRVARSRPAYRLPAAGRLLSGTGEISDPGYRTRGLALAVAPGSPVVAPAGGSVRFAGAYRSYGSIVIIDHAGGWVTLVAGLAGADVRPGQTVAMGDPIGRAAGATSGGSSTIMVELRRRGRVMDIAALL